MIIPPAVTPSQAHERLNELTVIDVRDAGEYVLGHLPGAHHVPLSQLDLALPALESAADQGELLLVCASGVRSERARVTLSGYGIPAATLTGGTTAWARLGLGLERDADAPTTWAMERQVRLAAGGLVLAGLAVGRRWPSARWLSAGIAGGLVFSALTNSCGLARVLAKLPHNRANGPDLHATLRALSE